MWFIKLSLSLLNTKDVGSCVYTKNVDNNEWRSFSLDSFEFLPTDWSFVPHSLFPKPSEVRCEDRQFGLIRKRNASPHPRWSTPAARGQTASADRLPQRRDAPKTISSSRGNSSILATSCLRPIRGTCLDRFPRAALRTIASFCRPVFSTVATLWIDIRRIRELYVTIHVWGLSIVSESLFLHTSCAGTNLIRSALFFMLRHRANFLKYEIN